MQSSLRDLVIRCVFYPAINRRAITILSLRDVGRPDIPSSETSDRLHGGCLGLGGRSGVDVAWR